MVFSLMCFINTEVLQLRSKLPTLWTVPTSANAHRWARFLAPCLVSGQILLLTGCAQPMPASESLNAPTNQPHVSQLAAKPAVPPGYRLESFVLCYEETRPSGMGPRTAPEARVVQTSVLVPLDDCLALSSSGWLSVVPGQCRPPVSTRTKCETDKGSAPA